MARIDRGATMAVISRNRPPQEGQAGTSTSNARCINCAHVHPREGERTAAPLSPGTPVPLRTALSVGASDPVQTPAASTGMTGGATLQLTMAARTDPLTEALETLALRPTRQNIVVRLVALAWAPCWRDLAVLSRRPGSKASPDSSCVVYRV